MPLSRRSLRLRAGGVVVPLLASVIAATAGPAAATAATLQGAGSQLIRPLESEWAAAWTSVTGNAVVYNASGSQQGISAITSGSVDFGASDAPMTAAQSLGCGNCVQIPWALTAVAVGFHVGSITSLKLTPNVLVKIYLGKITHWNDPRIQQVNPGVTLPPLAITPVFQAGGTGETYPFTDYLSAVSSTWRTTYGVGLNVSFPVGVAVNGDDGVVAEITTTNGAIGYLGASYAIGAHIPAAAIKNQAGRYELPNLQNIASAAQKVTAVPANNALDIVNPGPRYAVAYPISTFTYAIVPAAPPQSSTVQSFFNSAVTTGQSFGPALDFAKMPAIVTRAAEIAINRL